MHLNFHFSQLNAKSCPSQIEAEGKAMLTLIDLQNVVNFVTIIFDLHTTVHFAEQYFYCDGYRECGSTSPPGKCCSFNRPPTKTKKYSKSQEVIVKFIRSAVALVQVASLLKHIVCRVHCCLLFKFFLIFSTLISRGIAENYS